MRSNMFELIASEVKNKTEEEITQRALESMRTMYTMYENPEDSSLFSMMYLCAKIGMAGDSTINAKEKELVNNTLCTICNISAEELYTSIKHNPTDKDYKLLELITKMENEFALAALRLIMAFAYIDNKFEEDVAEKVDGLFGMNLLKCFFDSGMEEVPVPTIELKGLEATIFKYFDKEVPLETFEQICEKFPKEDTKEVKRALDKLVEDGLLYTTDTFIGKTYAKM